MMRILSGLVFLLLSSHAMAFGPDGHQMVGQLADERLNAQARMMVQKILKGDSAKSLADVAVWADEVKGQQAYSWSKSMHFVNLPDNASRYERRRDCPGDACAVEAINRFARVLSDHKADAKARVEALKFLVHFVGDLHQPLHAGRKADLGGNRIKVKWFGEPKRLHWVWDTGLIKRHRQDWRIHAKALSGQIKPEQQQQWQSSLKPEDWALSGAKLALDNAYSIPKNNKLGRLYYKKNLPVIQRQIQKAGVRLAAILNGIALK